MSYCRMGSDSDVYMYRTIGGYMFHLGKTARGRTPGKDFLVPTPEAAYRRMKRLQSQGFSVPRYAIQRLSLELSYRAKVYDTENA